MRIIDSDKIILTITIMIIRFYMVTGANNANEDNR